MVHLESVPSDDDVQDVFHVKPSVASRALVNAKTFGLMTNHASLRPDEYWLHEAERIAWMRRPTIAGNWTWDDEVSIRWFEDGTLNASVSCLDRHLPTHAAQPALIWEADEEGVSSVVTYGELHEMVCRLGNAMKALGVGRGDRVGIYLPMVPEAVAAMLACARIGAVHAVMFAGFSPTSIAQRLRDCGATLLITGDEQRRGGKRLPLKARADEALAEAPGVAHALVVPITGADVAMTEGRDVGYAGAVAAASPDCWCTRPAATWCGRTTRTRSSSISGRGRSSGARPTWAG
jgi:acetyl-CoA synthetase